MTTRQEAIDAAGAVLSAGLAEVNQTAATGGPEAVAREAAPRGSDKERASLAAHFTRLQRPAAA